ncbi:thioredoxin family protein [Heliorestis acidaminivorans]|uniref:Thioredoxin family protein n=1 Tax=Heliorestis acidaminivorans TaxID=553427 RepID=A0A6I0ES67_9FIRM|nr:thioredoxin family protein [Heliorestis acidaminivorans]KAB2952615.1 thioredoxin family protein [Heliorestis acidaminivorans]
MDIKVLGTGCPKCNQLEERVKKVVNMLGKEATVSKVSDIKDIMSYGVMMTPALVIDGEVKVSGKLPSEGELKALLD